MLTYLLSFFLLLSILGCLWIGQRNQGQRRADASALAATQTLQKERGQAWQAQHSEIQTRFTWQFQKLANDILEEKDKKFSAQTIAEQGGKLYDQVALFVESFDDLGQQIERSAKKFDEARKRLRMD